MIPVKLAVPEKVVKALYYGMETTYICLWEKLHYVMAETDVKALAMGKYRWIGTGQSWKIPGTGTYVV